MSERVGPPNPLPALTEQDVRIAFGQLMAVKSRHHETRTDFNGPLFAASLSRLRTRTTEWEVLFGDVTKDMYEFGIQAGIQLAQQYTASELTLQTAARFASRESLVRERDQIEYPHNRSFELVFNQRIKVPGNSTRNIIEHAQSLYGSVIGKFSDREPHVAEFIYATSLSSGHNSREPLINLGIMDTLDTFRALAVRRP